MNRSVRYSGSLSAFLLACLVIALLNLPFILIVYSIHYIGVKVVAEAVLLALALLLFPRRLHALLLLLPFMLLEMFAVMHVDLTCAAEYAFVGFCVLPKLAGLMIAYHRPAGKTL